MDWAPLLRAPQGGEHFVQVYTDEAFLHDTVAEYAAAGVELGQKVVLICTREHGRAFLERLACRSADLTLVDAEEALARCTRRGVPDWPRFESTVSELFDAQGKSAANVRAYGEMVDLLWQRGERESARRMEGFWCDLGRHARFSLLCAYRMDHLDAAACTDGMEWICRGHTHLIPARDWAAFDAAVIDASRQVLDETLARVLLGVSSREKRDTAMPRGQAMLLWLSRNMPHSAERVFREVRARYGAEKPRA